MVKFAFDDGWRASARGTRGGAERTRQRRAEKDRRRAGRAAPQVVPERRRVPGSGALDDPRRGLDSEEDLDRRGRPDHSLTNASSASRTYSKGQDGRKAAPALLAFCHATMRGMCIISILGAAVLAAGLTFTTPDGWRQSAGGSSMRVAEFTLPRADGDAEDAQLIVYYFGGQGGSVDANIQRWVGQMQQPDGRPSSAVAKKQTADGQRTRRDARRRRRHLRRGDGARRGRAPQQAALPAAGRRRRNAERPLLHQADRPREDRDQVGPGLRSIRRQLQVSERNDRAASREAFLCELCALCVSVRRGRCSCRRAPPAPR